MNKKQAVAVKAKPPVTAKPTRAKLKFSYTVMGLDDDRVLGKKKQEELDDESTLIQAFSRWVKSGDTAFYATRRK